MSENVTDMYFIIVTKIYIRFQGRNKKNKIFIAIKMIKKSFM